MFIAVLFTVIKIWKQAKLPMTDEYIKRRGILIYIQWNISHKKEWNFVICSNKDGPRGHYAKWNKSDRGKHILYDTIDM